MPDTLPARTDLSHAIEDYLKAVYALERGGNAVGTGEIATSLGVAPASASAMVKRLASLGLAGHTPYQGVILTDLGRQAVMRVLRRHRVVESYLVMALGYQWEEVHDEADRLEHVISDTLVERMAQAIGDPSFDPHGAPIPNPEGVMTERELRSLAELPVGSRGRIALVADEDRELLRYLSQLGLIPGALVLVKARAPFDGPVTLLFESGESQVVGAALTRQVMMELEPVSSVQTDSAGETS